MSLIRIREVMPLEGLRLLLKLTDGTVVQRDAGALLTRPIFDPIGTDPRRFREVQVEAGAQRQRRGGGPQRVRAVGAAHEAFLVHADGGLVAVLAEVGVSQAAGRKFWPQNACLQSLLSTWHS